MTASVVALMPLRGGSKSIPKKNVKLMAGKPLCYWGLQAALDSGVFSAVYVSTDCPEIKATVLRLFGERVGIIDRPSQYAQDTSSTEEVMLHFMSLAPFDVLCLIQATSPLTGKEDFQAAYRQFQTEKADSLVTTVPCKRFFWDASGKPLNYDPLHRPRRQDFAGCLMENGAFYFTRRSILEQHRCRLGGKIAAYAMDEVHSVEIDEPSDWLILEGLLKDRKTLSARHEEPIRMIAVDVDGTLTDGGMYYNPDGEFLKKFNTKDAHGLKMLEKRGVKIVIITAEDSKVVAARMKKLGFDAYYHGIKDKLPLLKAISSETGVPFKQIAYVGDDEGDMDCLSEVGFAACPSDAIPQVKAKAHFVSSCGGGQGAVREVCDHLLSQGHIVG